MKKIVLAAVLALSATVVTVNTASAFAFSQDFWDAVAAYYNAKNKASTSPGDAFDPSKTGLVNVAELREICLEVGGTPSRKFQGNDFQFYCIQ